MPIQWSGTITSPGQLASVIQGEAGTNAGQFAVASVMYNRMTTPGPYIGGGSNDITAVVTPTQFNGWNNTPSANATALANALWNGQPPPGGTTGNATFFAAPSTANASWANPNTAAGQAYFANGTNIGGNYYSDNQGPASGSFVAPNYGGASIANGPADSSSGVAGGSGATTGTGGDYITSGGTADPYAGDYTTAYPDPNTAFATGGASATGSGSGAVAPGAGAAATSGTNAPNTSTAAQGTPIQTALQPEETSFITSTVQGIEKAFGSGTQAVISAAENAIGTAFGGIANWFTRAFLIIIGLVLLAVAVIALFWDHGGKETVVNMGRMAAA